MAVLREIKRRIKTSKNISQVTRAMEMISAVKMRKAKDMTITGREYSITLENMVRILAKKVEEDKKSIFLKTPSEVKKILVIVIAPKKGLCGSLIGSLQRMVTKFVLKNEDYPNAEFSFVILGKKSRDIIKFLNKTVVADFEIAEKGVDASAIEPITDLAVGQLVNHECDLVFVAYTEFINTMSQKPAIAQFLPIAPTSITDNEDKSNPEFIFEPNSKEVLDSLILRYTKSILYQYFLESAASEHSARMVAMKSAHDSADEIVSDLSLYYNKMRQDMITTELADSVSSRLGQN